MRNLVISIIGIALTACNKSDSVQVKHANDGEVVAGEVTPVVNLESGDVYLLPGTDRSQVLELAGLNDKNGAKQLNYFATL